MINLLLRSTGKVHVDLNDSVISSELCLNLSDQVLSRDLFENLLEA